MSGFENAAAVLPGDIRRAALALPESIKKSAQEFRLRRGRPPAVLTPRGELDIDKRRSVSGEDLLRMLEIATGASPYTAAAGLEKGYVTAPGGVRVGLCGRRNRTIGRSWTWTGVTSAVVRVPREAFGCAASVCTGPPVSTLIAAPPGGGKTTLLRDMIRIYSDRGYRIGLCDERGEVAGENSLGTGFDVGCRTDVLTGLEKSAAACQLLRTMNPQIIAMDEITQQEDAAVCADVARCGVILLATAHADGIGADSSGSAVSQLIRSGVFRRIVGIRTAEGRWTYEEEFLS